MRQILYTFIACCFLYSSCFGGMIIQKFSSAGSSSPTDQFSGGLVRSIGTTATEIDNEGTITVASNIATFSIAFPTTMGAGDIVQYDVDNDGTIEAGEVAVIHGISTDRTKAYILEPDGTAAQDTTASTLVYNAFRAYTTLSNAESLTENTNIDSNVRSFDTSTDIVTLTKDFYFAVYADGVFDGYVDFDGWTTSSTYQLKMFAPYDSAMVGANQRHLGVFSTSYAYQDTSGAKGFEITDIGTSGYMILEGLQILFGGTAGAYFVTETGATIIIDSCIINNDSSGNGIDIIGSNVTIKNSAVYCSVTQGAGSEGIYPRTNAGTVNIWNSIVRNFNDGIEMDAGTVSIRNCAVYDNTTDFKDGPADTSTNNASDDGGGTDSVTGVTWADAFNDNTASAPNFHLKSGSALIDEGVDLSGSGVTNDIDRNARTGTWDIGVDAY